MKTSVRYIRTCHHSRIPNYSDNLKPVNRFYLIAGCNVYISTLGPVYPISLVRRIGTCIYAPF
ncbi:hypothetical protein BpHYR1_010941 [Brachionus plicatilis]|uniref:Uncharacterized protein n=1 Tax=Brachionus plicatilis TaxID=10195 RepID=A0A3M7P6Q7_BRAPC|nr:hypothetical protein BpHYR1_010941 [Brachionus plicatilis]